MINEIRIPEGSMLSVKKDATKQLKQNIYTGKWERVAKLVKSITWLAALKPGTGNVTATLTEHVRYEELEIFHVQVTDVQNLYNICYPIYKIVEYPCLLIIQYEKKYLVSICRFSPGKENYAKNILKQIQFSHWIFPGEHTEKAEQFVSTINQILAEGGDLEQLYNRLRLAVVNFRIGGISKSHVNQLVKDMLGKTITSASFWGNFSPYRLHHVQGTTLQAKYLQRKETYTYSFDSEDLWHGFMSDERLRRVITNRRYRDIEDLIYSIDEKYEEC